MWINFFPVDCCCSFSIIAILSLLLLLSIFFLRVDSDLTLYYYDKRDNHAALLSDKVIWITGGSSGLGEYLAYELSTYGCRLVLSGTSTERLEKVKAHCVQLGLAERDVLTLPFNMCSYEEHEKKLKDVISHFGKLDILVNNAGRSQRATFLDIDLEVDRQMFELNVFATLNLTRHVLRYFLQSKRGGSVVVTSSCVGKMGVPGSASYTGSKHALHGYFEALRTEMCRKNISVTIICPGPVFSNFLANAFTDKPDQKLGEDTKSTDRRMATDRCAHLMAVAIAHKLDEAWVALQPCLLLYYFAQYTPSFFRRVLIEKFYTPEIATKIREGRW